jgi:hypothetical protein
MWRRQAPRRIKYQPIEMKTVLTKLSDALIAGRSVTVMSSGVSPLLRDYCLTLRDSSTSSE